MKKQLLLLLALPFLTGNALSAQENEMAPYLPPEREIVQKSFLSPEDVATENAPKKIDLAGMWKFSGIRLSAQPFPQDTDRKAGFETTEFNDSDWAQIKVPLNWYRDPRYSYNRFYKEKTPFALAWYRRNFELTNAQLTGKRVILHFDVIGYEGLVFVNGKEAGRAHGDFVPSSFDITHLVKPGKNTLAVRVFSDFQAKSSSGIKTFRTYGAKWWWENVKGGLWQPVTLSIEPELRFDDIRIASDFAKKTIEIRGMIENHTGTTRSLTLAATVADADRATGHRINTEKNLSGMTLKPGRTPFRAILALNRPNAWEPANPNLYNLTLRLNEKNKTVSSKTERFGFREFKTDGNGFRLNGKHIYLFGENISSSDFGGFDRSAEKEDAMIRKLLEQRLKAGVVILRSAHMPPTRAIIRAADELGMMIYDEWSYSFSVPNMDEPKFEKTNLNELERFIARDFNAPSVVMWSLGNEVQHGTRPEAFRQLSKQIELAKKLDFQKRPLVPFSGVACIAHYGSGKFDADVLDLHTYHGIVDKPWTHYAAEMNYHAASIGKVYGTKLPLITWECIGYTWGSHKDAKFRVGNLEDYLNYATRKFTWERPDGIGYAAATGLAAMLDPDRGVRHAMDRQAGRIFDLYRQDARFQGFAGWNMPEDLQQRTRWNQPVYATLRSKPNNLPPRNLFSGEKYNWELFLTNDSPETVANSKLRLSLIAKEMPEKELFVSEFSVLEPGRQMIREIAVEIPEMTREFPCPAQLRLTLIGKNGKELCRNYANITLEPRNLRTEPLKTSVTVALYNGGNAADLKEFLEAVKLPFRTIGPNENPSGFDTLLIPPGCNAELFKKSGDAIRKRVEEGGACLVIFEQLPGPLPIYRQFLCTNDPNAFADLVLPKHPLFRNMTQEQFDLWSTAKNGDVLSTMISPITDNVLAAKPPFLVRNTVGMAILEAKAGKGRLIVSQLNACANWKTESAATRYLRNLLGYACNRPLGTETRPLATVAPTEYKAEAEDLVTLNLAPYANRSFTDEKDNDGLGGWTDQGVNDFRVMPKGKIKAGGIPFTLIDPAMNQGKGCLIVRGSARRNFPVAIRDIRIDGKYSRLFFLHTSAWSGSKNCGAYRIHYSDGSSVDIPLSGGRNIGDWWHVKQLSDAKAGFTRTNASGAEIGFFVTEWVNPNPGKTIAKMDFLSGLQDGIDGVEWVNPDASVPILAGLTGEKSRGTPASVYSGRTNKQTWWGMAWRGGKKPDCRIVKTDSETLPPYAVKVNLPAVENNGVPVVSTPFDASKITDSPRSVNFRMKADMPGVIDLVFPSKDWKSCLTATVELNEPGRWISVRLPVKSAFRYTGKPFPLKDGRNEFYLYNGFNQQKSYPRTAVSFELTGLEIE